ncbi:hypothetical protein DFH27DRAFT_526336 [Peziza echinospora]|nr:hypothetical protein DFH27DRAFT_526336 [Peziza echinospora]
MAGWPWPCYGMVNVNPPTPAADIVLTFLPVCQACCPPVAGAKLSAGRQARQGRAAEQGGSLPITNLLDFTIYVARASRTDTLMNSFDKQKQKQKHIDIIIIMH